MIGTTRSYSLVRTLILGSATLAVVGVLFAVYQSVSVPAASERPEHEPLPEFANAPPPSSGGKGVEVGSNVVLGRGSGGSINLYDAHSDQAKAVLSYQAWEPSGEGENQFHVTGPRISLRTPNGQRVEITSRSGLVQLRTGRADRLDLRSGKLMGDVRIQLDRLDDQQRAALPQAERDHPGPDRLVLLTLDEVRFDLEYAHLESTGPFHVVSAEADVQGEGLTLRYNELDSSIKELRVERRGRIIARGLGGLFRVDVPGVGPGEVVERGKAAPQPVAMAPPEAPELTESTKAAPEADDNGVLVLPLEQPAEPKVHATVTYRARFQDEIHVRQTDNGDLSGELLADVLELLFDFGQQQRDVARSQAGRAPDAASQPSGGSAPPPTEITVAWSGPLVVTAEGEPSSDSEISTAVTGTQVTASGDDVQLLQTGRGNVRCRKMVYHERTKRAWLYGTAEFPVAMETSDGGRLEGPEALMDMTAGTAHVTGPGRLTAKQTRSPLGGSSTPVAAQAGSESDATAGADLRFRDALDLAFADEIVPGAIDPATGAMIEKRRRYLQSAVFRGDVSMRQEADSLSGQRVEVEFDPPRQEGSLADNMRRLRAEGGVRLLHGEETVACERLEAEMGLDESGRIAPRIARAYERVSATQQGRTITASDHMIVYLRSVLEPRPAFDMTKAQAEAVARGRDPQTVDWDKVRSDYEREQHYRPGLERLEAVGDVLVRDPEQDLKVNAAALDCTFRDGRDVDSALVTGTEEKPAYVELDMFSITGAQVELDVADQSALVPGRGRLTFPSRRDLDGRQLDRPIPISMTWSERMIFRGEQNRAILTGAVHAATEESMLDCGELVVDFEERQKANQPGEAAAGPQPAVPVVADWWVFTPLVERIGGPRRRQPANPFAEEYDKEPAAIVASGGAVALTTKTEPLTGRVLSRGRIAGPRLLVDLRTEVLSIEDAGTLLIEDYELPGPPLTPGVKGPRKPDAPPRTPFGGLGVGSPSQTFISWSGQMAYYFGTQAALFERGVEMRHRSGTRILLGQGVLGDSAEALGHAEKEQGRDSMLTCEQLAVQFREPQSDTLVTPGGKASPARKRGGAGRMSGYELSRFEATGRIHFEDTGIVVLAHKIGYDAARNELAIRGSETNPAEIYDQRGKFQALRGPAFYWDRSTGRIDAPQSTLIGR